MPNLAKNQSGKPQTTLITRLTARRWLAETMQAVSASTTEGERAV